MSKHTLSRIPQHVRHIFKVYETASQLYRPYDDKFVSQFVDKSGSYYEQFNRSKLMGHTDADGKYTLIFNKSDFPLTMRDTISRIFEKPLQLEEKLELPEIPLDDLENEPLFSDWHITAKHFSDYQAKIVSSFASFYSPLPSAESPLAQKSYKWYQRLLSNTPVILFLSQKQRLMTESGMRGINHPLKELRSGLDQIKRRYVTDPDIDKRIRNYHLTDLVTTDLFKLAVENESLKNLESSDVNSVNKDTTGSNLDNFDDTLCARLHKLREPIITGKEGKPCSKKAISRIDTKYRLRRVTRAVKERDEPNKVMDIFPYDIHYHDLFMLTIERPIFQENHKDLLDLLRNQEHFQVFGARISRAEASSIDLASSFEESPKVSDTNTYEHLLQWAESHRASTSVNHVSHLLEQIGEWGLVEVEENALKSAFYVFEEAEKKTKRTETV